MYLFLGCKGLYQLADIFYLFTDSYMIGFVVVFLRFIYTYHLMICLFNESVLLPWQELLNKVKMTDQKLNDNQKDRHNIINLSHELKTPIHVIQSAADILSLDSTKEADSGFRMGLKQIKKICYQSTDLITNIIDNNKIDEGYVHPKYIHCNLVTLIDHIIIALDEYNSKWSIDFDPQQEEVYVCVDKELIQRSLLHLIALLIRHQKKDSAICIGLKILETRVSIEITSKTTLLPQNYTDEAQYVYSKENINELAALEFVKKVLGFYDEQLYLISNQNQGTTIYMSLHLSHSSGEEVTGFADYQENVNMLLSRIKIQYADL